MNKIQLKEHIEKIINYVGQEYNHGPKLIDSKAKIPYPADEYCCNWWHGK